MPRVSLQLHEIALSRVTLGMPALLSARLCLARFLLRPTTPQTTERQRQLLDDAKELVQMHERAQQTHCNFEVPDEISDEFLRWVADLPMKIWLSSTDTILPWTWPVNRPNSFPALSVVAPFVESRRSPRIVEASTVLQCKSFQVRHVRGARKHFPLAAR